MNRLEKLQERMRRLALAKAWEDSADAISAELEQDAREELAKTGTRPSWSAPDVCDVVLPLSKEAVVVDNITDLRQWVEATSPDNIQTVKEIRTVFQKWLLENAVIMPDGTIVHPETKQVIPGLRVRPGGVPQSLRFTPNKTAAGLYANYAAAEVERALVAEYGTEASADTPEIRCVGCGHLIRDGEPMESLGAGYLHAECPEAVAE